MMVMADISCGGRKVVITERQAREMFSESGGCPFPSSAVKTPLYHCGDPLHSDKFKDVIWFSDKPLGHFGEQHRYYVNVENPYVVDCQGESWSRQLWRLCCDDDGEPVISPDSPSLTAMAPEEVWELAQKDSEEWEFGDIPYLVACGHLGNGNRSVILKNVGETPNGMVEVTDYCVFSMDDICQID